MMDPCLIDFQIIGEPSIGYLSVAEPFRNIPFEIKRVYWVYQTPENVKRGDHANYISEHIIVCVTGTAFVSLENKDGKVYDFVLDNPNRGLYIPALHWRKINMTKETVCLNFSSTVFDVNDYIKEYEQFKK